MFYFSDNDFTELNEGRYEDMNGIGENYSSEDEGDGTEDDDEDEESSGSDEEMAAPLVTASKRPIRKMLSEDEGDVAIEIQKQKRACKNRKKK